MNHQKNVKDMYSVDGWTEVICFIFVNPQGIISCGLTELIYTESLIITYLSRLIATLSSSSSSSLYLPFSTTQII